MLLLIGVIFLWVYVARNKKPRLNLPPKPQQPPPSNVVYIDLDELEEELDGEDEICEELQVEIDLIRQDVEFWKQQLDRHYEMLWEYDDKLAKARQAVSFDREANKYGAVVNEKVEELHKKEFQKWLKKVTTLEAQIYRLERKVQDGERKLRACV